MPKQKSFMVGMGLISSYYPNDVDRSRQMGVALSGIAAGVLGTVIIPRD